MLNPLQLFSPWRYQGLWPAEAACRPFPDQCHAERLDNRSQRGCTCTETSPLWKHSPGCDSGPGYFGLSPDRCPACPFWGSPKWLWKMTDLWVGQLIYVWEMFAFIELMDCWKHNSHCTSTDQALCHVQYSLLFLSPIDLALPCCFYHNTQSKHLYPSPPMKNFIYFEWW